MKNSFSAKDGSGSASRHPPDSKDANKASTSSSSVQKVSDAINSIYKNAMSAASGDGEIMDTDLQALIKSISYLLQHKRFQKVKVSDSLLKVKDSFSAGMKNVLKDIFPANASEARKMAIHLLNRIGKINGAMTAGLLIVIYILEESETLSDNKSECLSLLNEMKTLAQYVINLKRRHRSKEEMVTDIIKQSIQLILGGSILCCTHMKSCRISQFIKAGVRKAELDNLRKEVTSLYPKLIAAAIEGLFDELDRNKHPQIHPEQIKYPNYAVGKELIGYNNLPEDLKDPFLDICSFFNRADWDLVVDVVGSSVLQRLEKRALVTRNANVLTVHDVIRELGIRKSKGTRIRGANKISELLNAKGSKEMDGIKGLKFTEEESVSISAEKLDPVSSSLRVLKLKDSTTTIVGDCNIIFPKLIFLDAGMNPLPFLVSTFKKLRYLSYYPQKPVDLNFSKMPSNLIRLKLNGTSYSRSFKHCSVDLHGLQKLRCLKFLKFKHLTTLPKELGSLERLEILHIIDCDDLEELPKSLGDLKALKSLIVAGCPKLKKLPESISRLTSLTYLSLRGCASLSRLPEHFGSLSSLKDLNLEKTSLKVLPSSFEKLSKLEVLYLASCSSLVDLPAGLGKLTSLVKLDLSHCSNLKELCINFYCLSSLQSLNLSSCRSLKKLPESFSELKCLIKLNLSCCNELQKLCKKFRDLRSLQHLTLSSCPMLAGKCMQKIVRMKKTIKVVDITKSPMLLEEWKTLKDTNPPSNISVKTGRF